MMTWLFRRIPQQSAFTNIRKQRRNLVGAKHWLTNVTIRIATKLKIYTSLS
jgi:hypothetical protein